MHNYLLYFLAQSFRAYLIKELPDDDKQLSENQKQLAHSSQKLLKDLANISLEIAQMVVSQSDDGASMPDFF